MLKLSDSYKSSCAPCALAIISTKTESEVYEECFKSGFKVGYGMSVFAILEAAKNIGLKVSDNVINLKFDQMYDRRKCPTAKSFASKHPNDVFIACNHNHAYVIAYGELIDYHHKTKTRNKLRITNAYKVIAGANEKQIRDVIAHIKDCQPKAKAKNTRKYINPYDHYIVFNCSFADMVKNMRKGMKWETMKLESYYRQDPDRSIYEYFMLGISSKTINFLAQRRRIIFKEK